MERQKKLCPSPTEQERLRRLWDEGINSGNAEPLDIAAIKREGRQGLARRK